MATPTVNGALCSQTENIARLGDSEEDYSYVSLEQSRSFGDAYKHVCHGMIFARSAKTLWGACAVRGFVLMQMRFDGVLGFPGGFVDPGEDIVVGLNREMEEEIGLNISEKGFTEADHIETAVNEKKKLVLHFFLKEMSEEEFGVLEKNSMAAKEFGIESLGVIRPPLYTLPDGLRGFPAFLANQFIGNARHQLVVGLTRSNLLTADDIKTALASADRYMAQKF